MVKAGSDGAIFESFEHVWQGLICQRFASAAVAELRKWSVDAPTRLGGIARISGRQDEKAVSTRHLSLCLHIFAYRDRTAKKETEPGKSLIDRLPLEMPCRAAAIAASHPSEPTRGARP
jgi:hypothetical protein